MQIPGISFALGVVYLAVKTRGFRSSPHTGPPFDTDERDVVDS